MTTGTDLPANTTHGSRGCFLNNWWNAKLWTLRSTPITQIAGHSSMNPCNWPEKLLFTLSLSSPKQGPLFQVDWCALSLWTDPLNPRPFFFLPLPPLYRRVGANILVKQTSTQILFNSQCLSFCGRMIIITVPIIIIIIRPRLVRLMMTFLWLYFNPPPPPSDTG